MLDGIHELTLCGDKQGFGTQLGSMVLCVVGWMPGHGDEELQWDTAWQSFRALISTWDVGTCWDSFGLSPTLCCASLCWLIPEHTWIHSGWMNLVDNFLDTSCERLSAYEPDQELSEVGNCCNLQDVAAKSQHCQLVLLVHGGTTHDLCWWADERRGLHTSLSFCGSLSSSLIESIIFVYWSELFS